MPDVPFDSLFKTIDIIAQNSAWFWNIEILKKIVY